MTALTTDPNDRRLRGGVDEVPVDAPEVYLVLPQAQRRRGFVKPLRARYRHVPCGGVTVLCREIAETYARDPHFYSATFCCHCRKHRPLFEFRWEPDGETLAPDDWSEAERARVRAELARVAAPQVFGRVVDDGCRTMDQVG